MDGDFGHEVSQRARWTGRLGNSFGTRYGAQISRDIEGIYSDMCDVAYRRMLKTLVGDGGTLQTQIDLGVLLILNKDWRKLIQVKRT